jgi:tetratricopeptide (TPR) repeat protein
MINSTDKINLFISYSHDDDPYFKVFCESLKKVTKNTKCFEWSVWDDTQIHVGDFWDDTIQNNIKNCNVALLLVSVGFMASEYIKEKEFNEFAKHYSDKGILIVPIMFKPCDFNRWEDLGKLQFFKPKGSIYGKAEIENFTYADLINFRQTDGTVIPNPNTDRYILDLVKKIEDSFKEFLSRTEVQEIITQPIILNSNLNKLSDYPKPSVLFTGRKTEIEEFKKTFTLFRIFAIEGLGGTGKTQFTAQIIEKEILNKDRIIWLDGSSQSNFDVFVENAGYGDVLKGEKKTDLALYSGLKDLIEKDERVIFWDNYNDYEDPSFSKFLSFANQYLQKATIILITKTEPSIERITNLHLFRLEGLNKDALEYATKLKTSNTQYNPIIDSDLEIICEGVNGHPLAIEFSMWLMSRGKSANDILLHMPEITGLRKVEEFSRRLFLDIFNHPKTTDAERECFLKCSIFKERISIQEINYLYDNEDVFHLLDGLMEKLLITFKEGFYEMHPLVRSFSYEKLVDKKSIHKKAADYLIIQRHEILNASLEEKIFYHLSEAEEWEIIADFIEISGRQFILQGQLGLLNDLFNKLSHLNISRPIFEILLGDIAQIKGEWHDAIIHFEKASHDEDIKIKAEGIIKHGEILFRRGDIKEALNHFESAHLFTKTHSLLKEEARALNDIGLVNFEFDKSDIALNNLNMSLKIRNKIGDVEGIADSYNNLGYIFRQKFQFIKASEFYNKSKIIAEEMGNKISLALYTINHASVLTEQNILDKALIETNLALDMCGKIGDKAGIAICYNNLGIIFQKQGKLEECISKFNQALKVSEEIGDKKAIASSFNNIGTFYYRIKNYVDALYYLFKSIDINRLNGNLSAEKTAVFWLNSISKEVGKENFKIYAEESHGKLENEIQKNIQLKEFLNEPQVRETPKVGNNDPCPCGSRKKYKKCCKINLVHY